MEMNIEVNDLTQAFLNQISALSEKNAFLQAQLAFLIKENKELKDKIIEQDKGEA